MLGVLYAPTFKDAVAGLNAQRVFARVSSTVSAAANIVTDSAIVPPDQAWMILGASVEASPGAAQTLIGGNLLVRLNAGGPAQFQAEFNAPFAAAVALRQFMGWGGELWMFPGEQLTFDVYFNAGVANNTYLASWWGISIPRANLRA